MLRATIPLAEALLHLRGVGAGDVSGRTQVRAPFCSFPRTRGGGATAGRLGRLAALAGRLPVLVLSARMFYHPHGQHRDVLGVHLSSGPWRSTSTHVTCQGVRNWWNRSRAMQLKLLHRAHKSPSQRHEFHPNSSPLCPKCKTAHCLWYSRNVQQFWWVTGEEISFYLLIVITTPCLYCLAHLIGLSLARQSVFFETG